MVALALMTAHAAPAQPTVAARVAAVRDGTVRFSFASRPGVCGMGANGWTSINTSPRQSRREFEVECERGPVRVSLDRADGHTVAVRTYVAGRWAADAAGTDLGLVSVADAAAVLLPLAEAGPDRPAEAAMQAVTLADSLVAWPRLAAIARNASRSVSVRKRATFWLSQAAGEKIVGTLTDIADEDPDDDVRKQAVFALSQRPAGEGVPALMAIARNKSARPAVRKQAYFWLGQTQDPRALAFLEETLAKP
jgi:hypothetical protein